MKQKKTLKFSKKIFEKIECQKLKNRNKKFFHRINHRNSYVIMATLLQKITFFANFYLTLCQIFGKVLYFL